MPSILTTEEYGRTCSRVSAFSPSRVFVCFAKISATRPDLTGLLSSFTTSLYMSMSWSSGITTSGAGGFSAWAKRWVEAVGVAGWLGLGLGVEGVGVGEAVNPWG